MSPSSRASSARGYDDDVPQWTRWQCHGVRAGTEDATDRKSGKQEWCRVDWWSGPHAGRSQWLGSPQDSGADRRFGGARLVETDGCFYDRRFSRACA